MLTLVVSNLGNEHPACTAFHKGSITHRYELWMEKCNRSKEERTQKNTFKEMVKERIVNNICIKRKVDKRFKKSQKEE